MWDRKETSPKSSSLNEIIPLLIVFHLQCSKYDGVKICFYLCRYKIKIFHSCLTPAVRVALVSLVWHSCHTCVALVLLVSHSCCTHVTSVALVLHSCCSCCTRVAFVLLVSHSCCSCLALVLFIRLDL